MSDSSSDHIIRLVVQGLNRLGSIGDQVAKETEKMTGAQDRHTKSVKANDDAIAELRKEYSKTVSEIKSGSKTYDDARFNLARLSAEFDKLARRQKLGSALAEDLNRSSLAAKRLAEQLKTAHETERKLNEDSAKDRVRREKERQQLTADTLRREVEGETRSVAARKSLVDELLGEVHRDHEERKRFARDLADFEIKEAIRVEDVRARSRATRQQGELVQERQSILQRVRGFFGGGDQSGGLRRFKEDLSGVSRGTSAAEQGVSKLDRALERMHGTSNKTGFSIAKVDNNLRGLALVGAIAFSQQLISALIALAGTMLAVASAAAQAGAAIGGALVAGLGQAIPTIGLLVAAFGRIGAVFDAVKLANNQATKSGRDQAATAEAQAAAADRMVSSQEQVVSATQRVREATEALIDARRKAVENIKDLNLAERSASLSRFQAEQALSRAAASGDIGALEGLTIQRDQSRLDSGRATTAAGQARSQGVGGSDQVRQAVQSLEEANVALGRANREMAAAQRAARRAATDTSAADDALKDALSKLSKAELGLYESVKRIQSTFKRLFRPITDIIVTAFSDAIDRVRSVLGDTRIIGPLRNVAKAIADSIRTISHELTSNRSLNFFKLMASEAARNIPLLTSLGIRLNRIFMAIAQAASPALRKFLQFMDDLFIKGDKATNSKSGLSKLERFFLRGEEMTESFLKLAGAVIGLFAALAGAGGADTGQSAIDQLTTQIKKATDWVNENQGKVKQFFKDSLDAAKSIAHALFEIGKAVATVFDNDKVKDFARAFEDVLLPAITDVIIALGTITGAFSKLVDLPVIGEFTRWAIALGLIHKALSVFIGILLPFTINLARMLGFLPLVGRAFRALAISVRLASILMTGPWGLAIAAVIAAIVILDRKFHFLGPTIRFIGKVFKDVFKVLVDQVVFFADKWLGLVTTMLGGISSLVSVASHLPFVGNAFKGVANFIDGAREKIDGWRESLRGMVDENEKGAKTLDALRDKVSSLKDRLSKLHKGSDEYTVVARVLRRTQNALNDAMAAADGKGKKGARGPRAIGRAATSAANAVDEANQAITSGYNQLAKQLGGIKSIKYTARGITIKGGSGDLTADSGDILSGTTARAMGGWIGGQRGGPQGPDDYHVRAGRGEAFVNVDQQGPVEEGLSLRSILFGGPGSLSDLFRHTGGAMFAKGGFVGGVDLKGAVSGLLGYARDAAGYGLHVSSGLRRGAITSSGNPSNHGAGKAIDLAGAAKDMLRFALHAASQYGRRLAELIHTPMGFGIKAGKRVPLSFWGATVNADHEKHVHLADTGAGGSGGIGGVAAALKRQKIGGPAGALRNIAQKAVDRVRRAADDRLGATASSADIEKSLGGVGRPANAAQIRGWIVAGLQLAGQKASSGAITTLFGRIMQESGGNPRAVNRTDINAQRGDPSKGILQTISQTFRAYMVKGHGNVFNPVDNIAAAVRYMLARYGHLVGRSSTGYATGGFTSGTPRSRTGYRQPVVFNTSVLGVIEELKRAQEAIRSIQTRAPGFVTRFTRSILAITSDGGLLDIATAAIQRVVDGMALKLRQATFSVSKSGLVIRRLTPAQQNIAELGSLDEQIKGLQGVRGVGGTVLKDIDRRLAVIRRGGITPKERKAYEALVIARRGLVAKINDVDVAIADAIEAKFNAQQQVIQDVIDAVTAQASRTSTRADLFDRIANLIEGAGASQAAFAWRANNLLIRRNAITTQRDQLGGLANVAASTGNWTLWQDLVGQIEDLNVQLLENTAAIASNTVAARQSAIDAITNRGGFLGGVTSGLTGILQTIGAITGTLDIPRLKALAESAGETLKQTGGGLKQQLFEGFNVDLRGLSGTPLVDALRNLDFGPIESASVELKAQFQGLINAIIDNEGAVQSNTQSLQELGQTVEQSFSSSAWQIFRRAVFDGSGGLLGQFSVPAMASGGSIMSSGLVFGHSGERILPARVSRDWQGSRNDTTNINITTPTEVADPSYIADVLSFKKSLARAT